MPVDSDAIVAYIPNLRRYARALAGERHAADDLVQDTLERAMRKFHLWRPGDLRAWLFSIMHNVFINQLRSKRNQPERGPFTEARRQNRFQGDSHIQSDLVSNRGNPFRRSQACQSLFRVAPSSRPH